MRAISIIARDTLLELSKRKVLLAILITVALTAVLFIVSISVVPFVVEKMASQITINGSRPAPDQIAPLTRQLQTNGYNLVVTIFSGVIEILGTLLALIMCVTFLSGEIERGSIKFLISKPVSRLEVVAGKWTAACMVLLCYSAVTSLLQVLASLYLTGGVTPDDIRAFPFLFFKLLMRGSVAMCLSIAMKPILAAVLAFFIAGDIFAFFARFTSESAVHYILAAISYLLPNYSIFPVRSPINFLAHAMGAAVPDLSILDIAARSAYAIIYSAVMLYLTITLFNKKDLT